LRQAYDYWKDQPGNSPDSSRRRGDARRRAPQHRDKSVRNIVQISGPGPDSQTTNFDSPATKKNRLFKRDTRSEKGDHTGTKKEEEGEFVTAQTPLGERQTPALKKNSKAERQGRDAQQNKQAETSAG
jgi:hypothetical protein